MMLSDQAKLILLVASFLGCLSTFFTSSSFYMGEHALGTLNPPVQRWCRTSRDVAKRCLEGRTLLQQQQQQEAEQQTRRRRLRIGDAHDAAVGSSSNTGGEQPRTMSEGSESSPSSSSCQTLLAQANQCENAVLKAYNHINMSGCTREIQSVTICEVEWCEGHDGGGGRSSSTTAKQQCQKECEGVRQRLQSCEKRLVMKYFARYGLNEDGVVATSKQ